MSLDWLLKSFSDEDAKPKTKTPKPAGEISLAGVLQRQRLRLSRSKAPRPASLNFSPSSITYNLCHRARIAQLAGLTTLYNDVPTPKLQLTFDLGSAIHDVIQGYYWDTNMLEGDFQCIKCDKTFYARSPQGCPFRKSHERRHLKFKEVVLKDAEHRISGRCDGYVWVEVGKDVEEKHLQDIKSIKNRGLNDPEQAWCYEDLKERGPKPDHVVQLNIYMWISGVHKGHLLYVGKNTSQITSFAVDYDHSVIEPVLAEIKHIIDESERIKLGTLKELPPPCSKKDCPCEEITL
jgi:hypothetical protein